jgi:hypothetical protein
VEDKDACDESTSGMSPSLCNCFANPTNLVAGP